MSATAPLRRPHGAVGAREGALFGALGGGLFNAVGGVFEGLANAGSAGLRAGKAVAHGVVGGTISVLRSGKFTAGFLSGAFAQATSRIADRVKTLAGKVTAAAVFGGIGAELGGGKFLNGATTGAFSYMYEQYTRDESDPSRFEIGEKNFVIKGGTHAEQMQAQSDIRDIIGTSRGQQMLDELESRGILIIFEKNFIMDLTIVNNAYTYKRADAIFVDPNFHPPILTTVGTVPATTRRIIAHEFGHAVFGIGDDGLLRMNNVIQNENTIMNALGQPSRLRY